MTNKNFLQYFGIVGLASIIFFPSCQSSKQKITTETLEIYSTKGSAIDKGIDSLKYYESSEYHGDKKISTSYFDHLGNMTGKEMVLFDRDSIPTGCRYNGPDGKALSKYQYITDFKGRVVAEYGFDANSGELLTIKSYEYDEKGRIIVRRIFEGDYTLYRKYEIAFDEEGNELLAKVSDKRDSTVLIENFVVAARDANGKWTERWGFVNDIPFTYYKRK